MLNIELPSDLTGYRHTCNGWFRREGMICAPVHVLADSPIAVLGTPDEARESTYKNRAISGGSVGSDNCRSSDSRGGRTIICGGGVEGHAALKATATLDVPRVNIEPLKRSGDHLADGVSLNVASRNQARPAAISGKGRWE